MTGRTARADIEEAGFTLIEALVVLAILSAVAAIALPRLSSSRNLLLDASASELVGALRATRSAAIAQNRPLVLIVDVEQRSFDSPIGARRKLPADTRLVLNVAKPEQETPSRGGIRFFPDGSSTGGEIVLALDGRTRKICVHWLTGQPLLAGTC
jgi:general secretion pathway protein H